MVTDVDSSTQGKSSDELKQMLEQTSIEVAEPEEETAEAVETTEEEAETSTEEETPEEKTTEEKKAEPEKKLYKIKVGGKEEELDEEKLKEYAQKGRYLERERAKDKEERKRLDEERAKITQPPDWNKLNEQFVDLLQKDPLGALTTLYEAKKNEEKRNEAEARHADRIFESEKSDVPYWESIKSIYQEFRDLGNSREEAFLKAENEHLKNLTLTLREEGFKDGKLKASMKEKAKMPLKEKKTKGGALPTPEELNKMTSEQLAKYLKFNKIPGW